jgi:hypothetical protein
MLFMMTHKGATLHNYYYPWKLGFSDLLSGSMKTAELLNLKYLLLLIWADFKAAHGIPSDLQ